MEYNPQNRDKKLVKDYKALDSLIRERFEKKTPRKEITQQCLISNYSYFSDVLNKAKEFAEKSQKSLDDVTIEVSHYEQYGDNILEIYLNVKGMETDEQYYLRLAESHQGEVDREEYERKEFERLSAKFTAK